MCRLLFILMLVFSLFPLSASAAGRDSRTYPVLKGSATVESDVIRLGDIFENVDPKKADTVIASAPPPGHRIALESGWLSSAARSTGVWWSPTTGYERVIVERLGIPITREQIEESILEAVITKGYAVDAVVELANRDFQIFAPVNEGRGIGVSDLMVDQTSRQFTVTVAIPAGVQNPQRLRLAGRIVPVTEVATLRQDIRRGEIVDENMIDWKPIRGEVGRQNYVLDLDQVLGMSVRRTMKAGTPLRTTDLQQPVLVRKGALVVMSLNHGNMALTAQGKALDNGALGDTVRVVNVHSKQTVEATVSGRDRVTISLTSQPVAN